jgi:hypothetical protein
MKARVATGETWTLADRLSMSRVEEAAGSANDLGELGEAAVEVLELVVVLEMRSQMTACSAAC